MKLKRIRLKKLKNTRDLGNFPTSNGKRIRPKLLIRSGHLAKASHEDISCLCNDYNLGTVIDLRIDAEIKEKNYSLPDGVNYIHIPLLDKAYLGITRDEYSLQSWFNLFKDTNRKPEDIFYEMYDLLVFGERSKELIPQIFDILLNSGDKAVLWHCSAGKDRVGVVTMLILLALGVDRDLIIQDFMATNRFSSQEIIKTRVFAPLVIKERRLRKCLAVLMGVKRVYMEKLFARIDAQYDGIEDFFMQQYGISSAEIEELKKKYLY
ncbi:MAG: tyrosine-protein phosphatase [Clostridia bacterium]|nr:tyrosine-protein phosphatase [Clostridia bacterium]